MDTEDVAMQVHRIAPGRFSWRKYPDQVNLELIRVALSDAAKPSNGPLVAGRGRTGWSLTARGQRWAEQNARDLLGRGSLGQGVARRAGSVDEGRRQRERARAIASEAWSEWSPGRNPRAITREAAAEVFRIDRYVVGRSREMKVNRLREMFQDDEELAPFLCAAAEAALEEEVDDDS